jgi:hypothetical protein
LVYAGTLIQHAGKWIGLAGLALLIGILALGIPGKPARFSRTEVPKTPAIAITALVLCILLVKVLWIAPHTTLFRVASPQGSTLVATHLADIPMGPNVRLIGWDIFNTEAKQGDEIRVRLYWQADAPLTDNYRSFVQIIAPDQHEYGSSNNMNPGNVPAQTWNSNYYIIDDHSIQVGADTPPIVYTLRVGLSPSGDEQARIGETDLLPLVRVLPRSPITPELTDSRIDATFANSVQLLAGESSLQGNVVYLSLFWRAGGTTSPGQQIFIHILDDTGALISQSDGAPLDGLYPPESWRKGEIVRDVRKITLGLDSKPAAILVGLYDMSSGVRTSVSGASANVTRDAVVLP